MMGMIAKGHVTGELWGGVVFFGGRSVIHVYLNERRERTRGWSGTSSFYGAVSA